MNLDETDKMILNMLQEDARRSFKDMAKKIGVSEATVFVRVRKLVKAGIIKSFHAILNSNLIGKGTAAFILLRANPNEYAETLKRLTEMDNVYEIYDITGPNYAILKVRTESPEKLAELIDKIGAIKGVISTETAMVLRVMKENPIIKL